ncbi:hypothetical protein M404DRAFT_160199, partial [Pisolithus tinctorius Marx 270]
FKRQLFHSSLTCILCSLQPTMIAPEIILCGDKYYQHVIYALAAYIADYEEQVVLSCIIQNWCPKCLTHWESLDDDMLSHCCKHVDTVIEEFDFCKLWDMYGIVGDIVPFKNNVLHADIYGMLSPDIFHQLIKGGFKDHLVDWVECYLIHVHGKTQVETVLDKIDWWYMTSINIHIYFMDFMVFQDHSFCPIYWVVAFPSRVTLQTVDW